MVGLHRATSCAATCRQIGNLKGREQRELADDHPVKQIYEKRLNTINRYVKRGTLTTDLAEVMKKLAKDKMLRALSNVAYAKGAYEKEMEQVRFEERRLTTNNDKENNTWHEKLMLKGGNGDVVFDAETGTARKYLRNTSTAEKVTRFKRELAVFQELCKNPIPNVVEVTDVYIDEDKNC